MSGNYIKLSLDKIELLFRRGKLLIIHLILTRVYMILKVYILFLKVMSKEEESLRNNHEEAITKIFLCALHVANRGIEKSVI